jgi:hypothetical protein
MEAAAAAQEQDVQAMWDPFKHGSHVVMRLPALPASVIAHPVVMHIAALGERCSVSCYSVRIPTWKLGPVIIAVVSSDFYSNVYATAVGWDGETADHRNTCIVWDGNKMDIPQLTDGLRQGAVLEGSEITLHFYLMKGDMMTRKREREYSLSGCEVPSILGDPPPCVDSPALTSRFLA